jgi:hypothetical protein
MSEKISMVRRLRLEANAMGEFQAYASRDYRRMLLDAADEMEQLRKERDEARRYSCDLEARITMLEEDRRDTSNNFGTNPCSEIILPDYPLARDPKEIAKRKGWDCYKEETK